MTTTNVVITGMGAVSPHGRGVGALWDGLLASRAAFREITLFDASPFRNAKAGEVDGYAHEPEGRPRAQRMLLDACTEALAMAKGASADVAIVAGTNFGGMSVVEKAWDTGAERSSGASLERYLFGSASAWVAESLGLHGPRMNLSLSCASGAAAIGLAFDLIRSGRVEAAIACGYDELSLFTFAGLSALRAMTPETIRPFDKRRKGTLFSEGAGALLLESQAHALRRNASPYARVLGRSMNNDGYHMTAPEQEATGIKKLMRAALKDADCQPERIDHVNLHATGTPYNDKIETLAVHAVFGERGRLIPVCSVKSSIGHTMGAAGLLESIVAVKSITEGKIPPVLGLEGAEKDEECDLNTPMGAPLTGSYRTVLKTSYGFGGTNAAVVLGAL